MGEYARFNGEEVKIGTCEDMYYLRFDQRRAVVHLRGNVDPVADVAALRFRFPWPDEDGIEPGSGEFHAKGFHRGLAIHGMTADPDADHSTVQFVAQAGYNVCLPCPESGKTIAGLTVHRNGFSGAVHLVAQKFVVGIGLVPILRCGGCGTMWREEDVARIEELAVLLRSEGDRRFAFDNRTGLTPLDTSQRDFYHAIADRLLAGITTTA